MRRTYLDLTPVTPAPEGHCHHPKFELPCLIPNCPRCRRHRKNDPITPGYEWICKEHWRATDPKMRRVFNRSKRRYEDACSFSSIENGFRSFTERDRWIKWMRAGAAYARIWKRFKRHAIERALGI